MMENVNPYYVPDARSDEQRFIDMWSPTCGAEEARRSWDAKQQKITRQSAMVIGDIQPYISQIDGTLIESRSKHRAHLKANNCIEIGNETKELYKHKKPLESPPGLKEHLIRAVNDSQRKRSY